MTFYPNNGLLHFFDSYFYNQVTTMVALLLSYLIVHSICRIRYQHRFNWYVSQKILRHKDFSDRILDFLMSMVYFGAALLLVMCIIMSTNHSEMVIISTQAAVTLFIVLIFSTHLRQASLWTRRKRAVGSRSDATSEQKQAFNDVYSKLLLAVTVTDVLFVPIYLLSMDIFRVFL